MGRFDLNYGVSVFGRALLRDFAQFSGRVERREFWHVLSVAVIVMAVALLIGAVWTVLSVAALIVFGAMVFVVMSLGVRRMHDVSLSGLWFLAPGVNFVLAAQRGRAGPNRFGPDPQGYRLDAFA